MLALDIPDGHYEMYIPSNMENVPFKIERPDITTLQQHPADHQPAQSYWHFRYNMKEIPSLP